MNEFKEAHKQHQKSIKENSKLRELRSDIDIIDAERGNGKLKKNPNHPIWPDRPQRPKYFQSFSHPCPIQLMQKISPNSTQPTIYESI